MVVAPVDAAQYHYRVAHAMAALTLRANKAKQSSVIGMLEPIQNVEYYLRTRFVKSSTYSGGKDKKKIRALPRQRAGATSVANAHIPPGQHSKLLRSRDHHCRSNIKKKSIKQVGIVYVDGANLWDGLENNDNLPTAIQKGQEGVDI